MKAAAVLVWFFWAIVCSAVGIGLGTCLTGCKPAVFRVEKIECPVEVPPEIIAAFFGCGWDARENVPVCPGGVSVVIPQLEVEACDMVPCDGGEI